MSKVFKVLLIIVVISFLFMNVSMALQGDEADLDRATLDEEETNTTTNTSSSSSSTYPDISAQVTKVDTLSNLPEANLGLNNILNVILISIGVLLILFAIAILIRLKKSGT